MHIFTTSGSCDPDKHYTVMRTQLLDKGQTLVEQGRYLVIFSPNQMGKTTYCQFLAYRLRRKGYLSIWLSCQGLQTLSREQFYQALTLHLQETLAAYGLRNHRTIENQLDLQWFLQEISTDRRPIVLIVDEFENMPLIVRDELLHTFRAMYHKRQHHKLQSLILAGVSTIAELVLSSASPFNVVDELRIPYFTFAEVQDLISQYMAESGQLFETEVIRAIYENTAGQPGLVCALCHYLVNEKVPDHSRSVTMTAFYATLKHFLTDRFDKNIVNVVQKAFEKREFMLRVLFSNVAIPFTVHDPTIAYLFAHGVIDNVDGSVDVAVPLYSKTLLTAFRPAINGEADHFVSAHDNFREYVVDGKLNVNAILARYRAYVERRGFHAFDTDHLKEGAWHYSLDGFINFFVEQLGGDTFVETPTGRGRTDLMILYGGRKYIIETKIFLTLHRFEEGKQQLVDYLTTEGLTEGYYVVFSNKHSKDEPLYFEETIHGKRIYTYLILTRFDRPSRRRKRKTDSKR